MDVHGTPCHVWLVNIARSAVRFCTCPVAGTRTCRSIILGSQIVEMGPYCSCVSVVLGSQNFAARAS